MSKSIKILTLYSKFLEKKELSKYEIEDIIGDKSIRTLQRYLLELNQFLKDPVQNSKIEYITSINKYRLNKSSYKTYAREHILILVKLLIASRSLELSEINDIIDTLTSTLEDRDKRIIKNSIRSEIMSYVPLTLSQPLLNSIWELSTIIDTQQTIILSYANAMNTVKSHFIRPYYITFSEFYFYLVGVTEDSYPLIFRIDRIESFKISNKNINSSPGHLYSSMELKKRLYFMYSGDFQRVKFEFSNGIIESVLDRFPTAKVLLSDFKNNHYIVEVEVLGDGILMWLLSQGDKIKLLGPEQLVIKYKNIINNIIDKY